MTVTITATMDSLFLRFFYFVMFSLKPFTNKKKLDYICLVAWFMFPDGDVSPPFKFLHFYTKQQKTDIGIVFSFREQLAENVTKRNMYGTKFKSSLLVYFC